MFGDWTSFAREGTDRTSPLLNPISGPTRRRICLGRYIHYAKLARVLPLLLRSSAIRRTPGVFTICRQVEHWLLGGVRLLGIIYIGGDARKGKIDCGGIEWRWLFCQVWWW